MSICQTGLVNEKHAIFSFKGWVWRVFCLFAFPFSFFMRLVWPRLATLVSWVFHVFGQLYYFDEIDKLLLGNDIVVNAECRKVDPCLFLGVTAFRTRECLPCDACGIYPSALCSRDNLLSADSPHRKVWKSHTVSQTVYWKCRRYFSSHPSY